MSRSELKVYRIRHLYLGHPVFLTSCVCIKCISDLLKVADYKKDLEKKYNKSLCFWVIKSVKNKSIR